MLSTFTTKTVRLTYHIHSAMITRLRYNKNLVLGTRDLELGDQFDVFQLFVSMKIGKHTLLPCVTKNLKHTDRKSPTTEPD